MGGRNKWGADEVVEMTFDPACFPVSCAASGFSAWTLLTNHRHERSFASEDVEQTWPQQPLPRVTAWDISSHFQMSLGEKMERLPVENHRPSSCPCQQADGPSVLPWLRAHRDFCLAQDGLS